MGIQVPVLMGLDRLPKEEAGELLDQRVHVFASTQELRYSTRNFVKLAGDYMGGDIPLYLSMEMWPRHIENLEW